MLKALEADSGVASTMLTPMERLGDEARRRIDGLVSVRTYLDSLRRDGLLNDAVDVLTYLLPKQYAIAWGCECWQAAQTEGTADPIEMSALAAAQRWLKDPSEDHRRAALQLADRLGFKTAGAWLAAAAGWSGGTMLPSGEYEVPPPPGLSGNAVAAALKLTAAAHPARYDEQLAQFIDRALTAFAPGRV